MIDFIICQSNIKVLICIFLSLEGCSEETHLDNYIFNYTEIVLSDSDKFLSPLAAMEACLKGLLYVVLETNISERNHLITP